MGLTGIFRRARLNGQIKTDGCTCWLLANENTKIQIWSYKESKVKTIICWFVTFFTLGALRLLFYWKPKWRVALTCDLCQLENAEIVLIRDEDWQWFLRPIRTAKRADGLSLLCPGGAMILVDSFRYFTHRKVVYVWHQQLNCFNRLLNVDYKVSCNYFHQCRPLTKLEAAARFAVYGANEIVVQLKPIVQLVFLEALNPFYVFQVFSVSVWFADEYYYYASVIVLMSVGSIAVDVYQIRKNQRALRDTIASTDMVTVIRDDQQETLPSTSLVPGDIIVIPQFGCVMQCDAVLICGNCIVNESMLTGESVPVTKTPIPKSETSSALLYDDKHHAKHTLYNGTKVLQTRYYSGQPVKAVVIRTGFSTTKGQLVRSIMYPKPVDFEFTKDLLRFVGVLACIAAVGFLYTIILMAIRGISVGKIIIRSFDIITIVVPPALPAAMTIGIMAAEQRLKKRSIYCISPSTINTCGGLNVVCFDKTGTLTEEGLDLLGVLVNDDKTGMSMEIQTPVELGPQHEVVRSLACCHSLTRIENELTGDPLDLILFRETTWILEEPEIVEESGRYDMLAPTVVRPAGRKTSTATTEEETLEPTLEIGILRQFTFSSSLQRMSVVVRVLGSPHLVLYCKGAPETVVALCKSDSVPSNFASILQKFTKRGYRVLALASRTLEMSFVKAQRAPREQLEADMKFLGLVIMENRLKLETTPVIAELNRANIRNVMVTGDNILTAISVARDCGILDDARRLYLVEAEVRGASAMPSIRIKREEISTLPNGKIERNLDRMQSVRNWDAENDFINRTDLPADYQLTITGPSFAVFTKHFPHLIPQLVAVCDVFARMAPEQKGQLVNSLQELGYIVAMCGDGANDCGALKAAHAGISLSEAEASIASPFTSKTPNIRCVPNVIREGRAALVTSFGIFKYMAGYSLTQFMSVSILYWIGTNLADFQFLYIDLFLITVFAVFFGYTPAAETLAPSPPPTRILSTSSITSIFLQLLIVAAFQVFAFQLVTFQPWFVPFTDPGDEDNYDSYQGAVVFLTSVYQYVMLAVIYSKSHPYRKSLFSNRYLSLSLIVCTAISFLITVYPPEFVAEWLELKMPPFVKYRFLIVLSAALNFFLSALAEKLIIDWFLDKVAAKRVWCKRIVPPKYVGILEQVGHSPSWLYVAAAKESLSSSSGSESLERNGGDAKGKQKSSLTSRLSSYSAHEDELTDLTPMCGDKGETTNV